MITVTLFCKNEDEVARQILQDLQSLREIVPHQVVVLDIEHYSSMQSVSQKGPIVEIGPYRLEGSIKRVDLQVALMAARDRALQLEQTGDKRYQRRMERGAVFSRTDRFSLWFTNHYMLLINFLVFLYVGIPFLAPALMKIGADVPAKVIYTVYSPLCHQLAFRSFFLFGEQLYYPRELAHVPDVLSYEEITGSQTINLVEARQFIGNERLGYKVALCQRDVAIYGAILLFGFLFSVLGRRVKQIPWYLWIAGLVPIGFDGLSQLPGLMRSVMPSWIVIRESTPILRLITGGIFGWMTAWYLFPLIEESMSETHQMLKRKFEKIKQTTNLSREITDAL